MPNNLKTILRSSRTKLLLSSLITLMFSYEGSSAESNRFQVDIDDYGNERLSIPTTLENASIEGKQITEPLKEQVVAVSFESPESFSHIDIEKMTAGIRSSEDVTRDYLGLSIDGGGIRGLIPALWLEKLEETIQDDLGDNIRLSSVFDCIGGTSIGGILALGLGKPMASSDLVEIIEKHKDKIFPRGYTRYLPKFISGPLSFMTNIFSKKYDHRPLESLLKEYFPETLLLKHAATNLLITTAAVDNTPISFGRKNPHGELKMWEIGRCTSAAPTYFEAHTIKLYEMGQEVTKVLVDGGIWANNPSPHVVVDLMSEFGITNKERVHLLSLGTGQTQGGGLSSNAGMSSAAAIIDALMSNQTNGNHKGCEKFLGKENYTRINASLPSQIDLDNTSPEAITLLKKLAEKEFSAVEEFYGEKQEIIRKKLEIN